MTYTQLMDQLWQQYTAITPSAAKIHALLGKGAPIINDHIALRTMRSPQVGVDKLGAIFKNFGYQEAGEYFFKQKKLYAKHFQSTDETLPKIFISELIVDACSSFLQETMQDLVAQIPDTFIDNPDLLYSGTHWHIPYQTYQALQQESEYAAWFAALGYRANHFTVYVNALSAFDNLNDVNTYLLNHGFTLNQAGGLIKGSPAVFLEQSATIADRVEVAFRDGTFEIPGCFYEFAKRYPMENGQLYQGFVEASADKIFQSTDTRPS